MVERKTPDRRYQRDSLTDLERRLRAEYGTSDVSTGVAPIPGAGVVGRGGLSFAGRLADRGQLLGRSVASRLFGSGGTSTLASGTARSAASAGGQAARSGLRGAAGRVGSAASRPFRPGGQAAISPLRVGMGAAGVGGLGALTAASRSGSRGSDDGVVPPGPRRGLHGAFTTGGEAAGEAGGAPSFEELVGPNRATDIMSEAWNATAGVEARYQQQLGALRQYYQFAETPEEKAQLQFILSDIEGQRAAGHTIIGDTYGGAIADTRQAETGMREQAAGDGERIGALYNDAAQATSANVAAVADRYEGGGMGVGAAPVTGDATDWANALSAAAPTEAAAAETYGNIAADDLGYLASTMGAESAAQQGEIQRVAMQLGAQAQIDHQRQVAERTARERMAFAQQAAQLGEAGIAARMGMSRDLFDAGLSYESDRRGYLAGQQQEGGAGGDAAAMTPTEQLQWAVTLDPLVREDLYRSGALHPMVSAALGLDRVAGRSLSSDARQQFAGGR